MSDMIEVDDGNENAQEDGSLDEPGYINPNDIQEEYVCEAGGGPDPGDDEDDESMEGPEGDTEMQDNDEALPVDTSVGRLDHQHEPVFCLATHPINPHIFASGGADDLGHIWNLSSGQEILKLEGHQDSVSTLQFSRDGSFLATGSVDATIKIWKTSDPHTFLHWEFLLNLEASEEVTWLTWHPTKPVLLAGFSDGMIYMWQIPTCTMRVFAGHDSMTTCGAFTPDGQKMISGTESGMLFIWELNTAKTQHKINLNEGRYAFKLNEEEQSGINSLAINQASTICVVGGISNGGVRIVNLRMGTVIAAIDEHQNDATVEVGIYEPSGLGVPLLISTGTDGQACIHDASSFKLRNSVHHKDAITTFIIHQEKGLLTTGSLDKSLSTWDLKTAEQLMVHSGHCDIIHMVKLTTDSKKLVSCSDDGFVLVFNT